MTASEAKFEVAKLLVNREWVPNNVPIVAREKGFHEFSKQPCLKFRSLR